MIQFPIVRLRLFTIISAFKKNQECVTMIHVEFPLETPLMRVENHESYHASFRNPLQNL